MTWPKMQRNEYQTCFIQNFQVVWSISCHKRHKHVKVARIQLIFTTYKIRHTVGDYKVNSILFQMSFASSNQILFDAFLSKQFAPCPRSNAISQFPIILTTWSHTYNQQQLLLKLSSYSHCRQDEHVRGLAFPYRSTTSIAQAVTRTLCSDVAEPDQAA